MSSSMVYPEAHRSEPHHTGNHRASFFRTYIWSHDHKMIALQYFWTALFFLIVGGLLAVLIRWQVGFPHTPLPTSLHYVMPSETISEDGLMNPKFYNAVVTMHATIMVFLVIMPMFLGFFANFVIPLQIGTRDMAFPFFNALSYWLFFTSGVIFMASFFVAGGASNVGWTAYTPLASMEGYNAARWGVTLWGLGIFVNGLASLVGAFNYVTTILNMRAPGMHMFRLPLVVWSLFVTALIILMVMPILSAAGIMLLLDLNLGTCFFNPANGGQPLLWQHLFWFFGHPEVYIIILPGMGVVSDILSTFSRKPIFGYKAMVYAIAAIAIIGMFVWAHHMFVSGMNPYLSMVFSVSTMVVAVPSAIKTFNWLGTIYRSSIRFTTPMLFALGFISLFISGGLSGIFLASATVNLFVHHTYFVVAHFHYIMVGASLFAFFAGFYYWFPKVFGRMPNVFLGNLHFALTFLFFNLTFIPMHNVGLGGMMRRIADPTLYEHLIHLQPTNQFISLAAFALAGSQILFFINLFYSLRKGEAAPANPWKSNTLEWTVPSPPGHGNFPGPIPTVYHGPHEYSVPGMAEDHIMQTDPRPLPSHH